MKYDSFKETMAAMERTKKMIEELKRESLSRKVPQSSKDFVSYLFKQPDYERGIYVRLHGSCYDKGSAELINNGYLPIPIETFSYNEKKVPFVTCSFCNKQLDPVSAKVLKEEKDKRALLRKLSYDAYIEEQILLGLI